jgi:hypothetical protein
MELLFFVRLVKKKCGLRGGIGCGVLLGAAVNPLSHWTTTPCLAKLCWLCSCMCGWVGGRWVLEPCRESYRLGEASNSTTTTTPHPTHMHTIPHPAASSLRGNNILVANMHVHAGDSCNGYGEAPNTDGCNVGGINITVQDLFVHNGDDCA